MTPQAATFLTGVLVVLSSACVLLHEIILKPETANYPDAFWRVRLAMFGWGGALLYRGAEILDGLSAPVPVHVTEGSLYAALWLAVVQALLLEQDLRRRLPMRLQRRVQQLIALASCRRQRELRRARQAAADAVWGEVQAPLSPAVVPASLAELKLRGATVVAPGESPEEWLRGEGG